MAIPILRHDLPFILHRLITRHQPARMEDIEHANRSHHHCAIERNEVLLPGDEVSGPALRQLDGTIDTSNIDAEHGEHHGAEKGGDGPAHCLQKSTTENPADEIGGASDKDGNREHLKDNTGDHDVGSWGCVAIFLVHFYGSHAAADGLDDERDDVAGAEDPEVHFRAKDGGLAAKELDEPAKEDVDACREECGSNDQGRNLHQEGSHVVGTFCRPCTSSPTQDLRQTPNTKDSAPPNSFPSKLNCVYDHREAKENEKYDACSQRRLISVRSVQAIYETMAASRQLLFKLKVLIGRRHIEDRSEEFAVSGLNSRAPVGNQA